MTSREIEEKLKKADCTVEELLEEDEIIQEMKNQNNKLLNFFEKDKVRRLVEYITVEPVDDDNKTGHRYPFISSEILNCDVGKLNDYFLNSEADLKREEHETSEEMHKVESDMKVENEEVDENEKTGEMNDEDQERQKEDAKVDDAEHSDQIETVEKIDQVEQTEQIEKVEQIENTDQTDHIEQTEKDNVPSEQNEQSKTEESKHIEQSNPIEQPKQIENQEPSHNIELLDLLLNFVNTDNDLNYVLAGYFSKLISNLINKYPHRIIAYIYNHKTNIIDRIIQHSDMKSISDLVPKFILIENYGDIKFTVDAQEIRRNALLKLFNKINLDEDMEKLSNVISAIFEITENKHILEKIINDVEILNILFSKISQPSNPSQDYNYTEILVVIINILKLITIEGLKIPTNSINDEDIVNSDGNSLSNTTLGEFILNNLEKILVNFNLFNNDTMLEGTHGITYYPLGNKKVRIVEFVHQVLNYFKNIPQIFDNILIHTNFFQNLFHYFFQYEWNNLYQHQFDTLLKYYLRNVSNHQTITQYLFNDLKILYLFSSKNDHFTFNSNRSINRGYLPIMIELSDLIHHCNDACVKSFFNDEWNDYIDHKVNPNMKMFSRRLCVQEAHDPLSIEDEFKLDTKTESINDSNPFKSSKEENVVTEEDWTGQKNDNNNNFMDDIHNFEFVDENKTEMQNEIFIQDLGLKVDELDNGNFNDANFWRKKFSLPEDEAEKILRELEL